MMTKTSSVLSTISSLYHSLTKSEKKIADTILLSPDLVVQSPLSEIAKHLDVGEATLVRFCRTVGFKGFSDFKLELSIELATKESQDEMMLDTDILASDNTFTIAQKLQASITSVVNETINLLDLKQLDSVVGEIKKAGRVFIFGAGSSGVTAEDAKNKLMRIGIPVDATGNNHFMYMQAALLKENDVAIGISHSGYSQETAHALKIAQQTVAITHSLRSPVTEYADYVLVNGNKQGKLQGDSIRTKIAQLFVLDLIYALLVQSEEEQAAKIKQKTLNVILEQRVK